MTIRPFALVALLIMVGQAQAQFTAVTDIPLSTTDHHGIAFDGTTWYIAAINETETYHTYDVGFNFLGDVTVTGPSIEVRGLTLDPNSGNLFLGDNDDSSVWEVTPAGSVVQSFTAGSGNINGLAYDPLSDTIWLARFNGDVERYGRTGGLLGSFSTAQAWTGIALDICSGNLLLLETGDTVYEYQTDGTLVAQVITTDQITGADSDDNGQGLYYDPATALLYATSQFGPITLFQDSTRATCGPGRIIPTLNPGGLALLALLLAGLGAAGLRWRNRALDRR